MLVANTVIQGLYDDIANAAAQIETAITSGHLHAASLRRLLHEAEEADYWFAVAEAEADDPLATPYSLLKVQDATLLQLTAIYERLLLAVEHIEGVPSV